MIEARPKWFELARWRASNPGGPASRGRPTPGNLSEDVERDATRNSDAFRIDQRDQDIVIEVAAAVWTGSALHRTSTALALADLSRPFAKQVGATVFSWSFSKVELDKKALETMLEDWRDRGEPPVLSLIALATRSRAPHLNNVIATRGLEALAGYEIEAAAADARDRLALAQAIARIARMAVMDEVPEPSTTFAGPPGEQAVTLSAQNEAATRILSWTPTA